MDADASGSFYRNILEKSRNTLGKHVATKFLLKLLIFQFNKKNVIQYFNQYYDLYIFVFLSK